MLSHTLKRPAFILTLMFVALFGMFQVGTARAADKEQVKIVTVTVNHKNSANLPQLSKDDFLVSENGVEQQVLSVVPATSDNAPLNLAIAIQADVPQINSEIPSIKKFIEGLPTGSQVMVVYLEGNFVNVAQQFTPDLQKAAKQVHVVGGFSNGTSSPYISLMDVMKHFNGLEHGRNEVLLISSGFDSLDTTSSPTENIHLNRAIKVAQQQNITVYSINSPSARVRGSFSRLLGQGALNYLAEQTGGYAFSMGISGFVGFDAPLAQLDQRLRQQYVIAYRSTSDDKDFRNVKVTTDFSNIKIEVIKGYKAKS